jgi:integrase
MPRKIKPQEIPLTKEIIQRLLRNVSPKLQTVILVVVSSGMRISELVQLRIGDVNFDSEPTRIRLRAETTKTRTARDVFITKEATLALKDYLRRYHRWNGTKESIGYDKMLFGRTSISRNSIRDESELKTVPLIAAKSLLQKSLECSIKNVPDLNMKSVDGKRMIHFHAFRKFFRTTVGNVSGRDFAEALMGHQFYLDTYYQLPEEKKKAMYLDVEPYLTISDFENVEKKLETISVKYSTLNEKFNNLLRYFEKNSVTIPEDLK